MLPHAHVSRRRGPCECETVGGPARHARKRLLRLQTSSRSSATNASMCTISDVHRFHDAIARFFYHERCNTYGSVRNRNSVQLCNCTAQLNSKCRRQRLSPLQADMVRSGTSSESTRCPWLGITYTRARASYFS